MNRVQVWEKFSWGIILAKACEWKKKKKIGVIKM